jgi:uncharacterized protein YqgV (UPF0045/DUF77 family)
LATQSSKSKRVSVSKKKLAKQAVETKVEAVETAVAGAAEMAEGMETLEAASDLAGAGQVALAAGASDLTRAMDAEVVAGRLANLSQVVSGAGTQDIAEGAL